MMSTKQKLLIIKRNKEIKHLISQGWSITSIANHLGVSVSTVKRYIDTYQTKYSGWAEK